MRSAGVLMSVVYFIRRRGDVCAVIELHPDNREEIIQDGLSLIEAEVLCVAKMADIPRAAACKPSTSMEPDKRAPAPSTSQLTLKF
jgi:hypothetical protein